MKNIKYVGKLGLTYLFLALTILSTGLAIGIITLVEAKAFNLLGYIWQGPHDISFWFLALAEIIVGFWLGTFYIPKWFKFKSYKEVYNRVEPAKSFSLSTCLSPILIGLSFGIGFSGMWKIVLMLLLLCWKISMYPAAITN